MRYINKNEPPAPCSLSLFTVLGVPLGVSPVPPHCFCFLNSPRVGLFAPSLLEAGLSATIPHATPIHSHSASHSHSNFLFLPQFILFLFINGRPQGHAPTTPHSRSVSRSLHVGECNSPLQPHTHAPFPAPFMLANAIRPYKPSLPLRFPLPSC